MSGHASRLPQPAVPARLELVRGETGWRLTAAGDWVAGSLASAARSLERLPRLPAPGPWPVTWELSAVGRMDSAGMLLLLHHRERLERQGGRVEIQGARPEHEALRALVEEFSAGPPPAPRPAAGPWRAPLIRLGRHAAHGWRGLLFLLAFLGRSLLALLHTLRHPTSLRLGALARNIEDAGIRALPIIILTSFLVGVVIAYQGAVQLQKFGANLFIVDMIGISVTRELAPLITAIVVAGRTGSAWTAQLGVMKLTEEIDAMRVMGFDPWRFLVLPRILALMIALPLLICLADLVGILGGMVVAHLHLNLSWSEFLNRLRNVLEARHFWIGIAKGPCFAWLIAVASCLRGLQVSRDTESIGRYTTISVVNAIFLVIACDALFSVALTELGW